MHLLTCTVLCRAARLLFAAQHINLQQKVLAGSFFLRMFFFAIVASVSFWYQKESHNVQWVISAVENQLQKSNKK